MRVLFKINYVSSQSVRLITKNSVEHIMVSDDMYNWHVELDIYSDEQYYYMVVDEMKEGVYDNYSKGVIYWRRILVADSSCVGTGSRVEVLDEWRESMPYRRALESSFYRDVVLGFDGCYSSGEVDFLASNVTIASSQIVLQQIILQVECPYIKSTEHIVLVGSGERLGQWDLNNGIRLERRFEEYHSNGSSECSFNYQYWVASLDGKDIFMGDEYKFVVCNNKGELVYWEDGENRVWEYDTDLSVSYQLSDLKFRLNYLPLRKSGVVIPLFSLRSEHSSGIGDFMDLVEFARWVGSVGGKVVQILPINDTTITSSWCDSYPYNSISVNALHPLYLSLDAMGILEDVDLAHQIADKREIVNDYPEVDYDDVLELKWQFFWAIYNQEGHNVLNSNEYKKFYDDNQEWLLPYSMFSYFRDSTGVVDYAQWGDGWQRYDKDIAMQFIEECDKDIKDKILIYHYLQYHLDKQLRMAKMEARQLGVSIKGDLPIGISRYSVETWTNPEFFNLEVQAGAPPDEFSTKGQNWGFPTYNWDAIKEDNYGWWTKRLQRMARYFDIYRIDHILGFFRIWEIPSHSAEGLLGQFNPALPLTKGEIESYGLKLSEERMATPYITKKVVAELFGKHANFYKDYTEHTEDGIFVLKEEFNTQRKLDIYFEDKSVKQQSMKEALYVVCNNVLFVKDRVNPELLHPRINAHQTISYKSLSPNEQEAYDKLYNDFFYIRHNSFWSEQALERLPSLINATDMLCCAEDLGMVPSSVKSVLNRFGILSLDLEFMPKLSNHTFADTSQYSVCSVATTSTHDMRPIRLWWQEQHCKRQQYYNDVMNWYGEAPDSATREICENIVSRTLSAPSLLALLPWSDWVSVSDIRVEEPSAERINIPDNANHYWQYRMNVTIEELITNSGLNNKLRELIINSNRI